MTPASITVLVGIGSAILAIVVWFGTDMFSWVVACALAGVCVHRLLIEREIKRWLANPLRPRPTLNKNWQGLAMNVARTIRHSRDRSRALLSALQRIRTTSNFLPDAWIILQRQNQIEMFNQSAIELLGIKQSDQHTDLSTLVRHPSLSRMLKEEVELIEIASPVNDAKRLEIRMVALDDNRKLILVRDVTELNRLLSMRQEFIANVSHELRTPLTVMFGYVESMVNDDLDKQNLRNLATRLVAPVDRMRFMVDDLLTLTQLESAPPPTPDEIQKINVKDQLNAVIEEVASLNQCTHLITLHAEDELQIECVPSEIHSVFMNLVTNAIRYSPDGGEINISCVHRGSSARIQVRDQGVGIPPESISRLTERFYRVDMKGSRARGGTGLGLAIVKHVLIRHQSELQIESSVGEGSVFFFDLPLQFTPEETN